MARTYDNWFVTNLTSDLSTGAQNIYLDSLPTYATGWLVINPDSTNKREIVYYTVKGATYVTVTAANRGLGGTTDTTHAAGAEVRMNIVSKILEEYSAQNDQVSGGWVQDAGGLNISVNAWNGEIGGTRVAYAGITSQAVTNNTTTYVELASNGTLYLTASAFTAGRKRLAVVVAASGDITSVTDSREFGATTGAFVNSVTAGDGLDTTAATGDITLSVDYKANDGLAIKSTELSVDYDNSTIGIVSNKLAVKDTGIGETQLATDAVTSAKIKADNVNDTHIDWGTGANQVSADDVVAGATYSIPTTANLTLYTNHLSNTSNPHSVTYTQAGAIQDAADTVKDTHVDWGTGASQVSADDVPDGSSKIIPSSTQETNWDTAYGWGNHASAGYITSPANLATQVTGALPVANGGTNVTSYTKGDMLVASAATTLTKLGIGTNDYVLVADSSTATGVKWAENVPGSGANTALSNLASVAINTTLVSDTTNTDDLGSTSVLWRTGYFQTSIFLGKTSTTTGQLKLYNASSANATTIQAGNAAAVTYTLPVADGTAGYVLSTDGAGTLSWAAGSAGANTTLSNLGTTAINANLLSASTQTIGTSTTPWTGIYGTTLYSGKASTTTGTVTLYHASSAYSVSLRVSASNSANWILTLPTADGDANQSLTTDGSGNTSWTTMANPALSNLTSVAINASLIGGSGNAYDLGSSTYPFRTAYLQTSALIGKASTTTGQISLYNASSASATTIQAGNASGAVTYTLPTADGTSGQVLSTNASGALSWATRVTPAMDNLASVAINTSLISDATNTDDLGSSTYLWRTGYFQTSVILGKASTTTGQLKMYNAGSAKYTALQAGSNAGDLTFTLPVADGSANQVLKTDGAGTLSWTTAATTAVSNSGYGSRAQTDGDGTVTIAHGLGATPKTVRLFTVETFGVNSIFSNGEVDDDVDNQVVYRTSTEGGSANGYAAYIGNGSSVWTGIITVDATNIYIAWDWSGSSTNNNIAWTWLATA